MSLFRQMKNLPLWFKYGSELAALRLQMLKIDLSEQTRCWVKIAIAAAALCLSLLAAFLCLLFGLNALLPPETKVRVFLGAALLLFVAALVLAGCIVHLWRIQGRYTQETLQLIGQDLRQMQHHIQGKQP